MVIEMKFCGRRAMPHHKINAFVFQKRNHKFTEKVFLQLGAAKYE